MCLHIVCKVINGGTMSKATLEKIKATISYDPGTGTFLRLRGDKRADTAMVIGYRRVRITIDGVKFEFLAHRLAWFLVNGSWPKGEIDHINGNREDNRIANLRDVTRTENARNLRLRFGSSSGYSGISRHQTGWKITISGKYVGYKGCLGEAITLRKTAEKNMDYHKNHGRRS